MIRKMRLKRRKLSLGERFKTINYGVLQIIGFETNSYYKVRFLATGYETSATIDKIKAGKVKDKLKPVVYGVGCIGDGEYSCGTHKTIYDRWKHMLARCYSEKFPDYIGCSVCPEWLNFQTFAKDIYSLPGYNSNLSGLDLDKDTLIEGNRIYSPSTCCFIPHSVNFKHALRCK